MRTSPLILSLASVALAYGQFEVVKPESKAIFGNNPKLTLLNTQADPIYHEAAVWYAPTQSLFVSSNQFPCPASAPCPETNGKQIVLTRVTGLQSPQSVRLERINAPGIPLPNGGIRFLPSDNGRKDEILFCAQGNLRNSPPNGIVSLVATPPYRTRNIVSAFKNIPFNSPNDVIVGLDGGIWFTDPSYGAAQGVRPAARLPNQVYRFDPKDNTTRVAATGFVRPNGIAFGVGEKQVFVTDTGTVLGDGTTDPNGPKTIYIFDVVKKDGKPSLGNRRTFAVADNGIPDGLKVDTNGNVYAGQGDGVAIFNKRGTLIGKIKVDGGVANFAIADPGVLFLLNEQRLFRADISKTVKNAGR